MNRRQFITALGYSALTRPAPAATKTNWQTNPRTGERYWDELVFVPTGTGGVVGRTIRHVSVTFEDQVIHVDLSKPLEQVPGSEFKTEAEVATAKAKSVVDHPEREVDTEGYSFGKAGLSAAGGALAYGVAASIAGLPNQAERIAGLRKEIRALQDGLAQQVAEHQDVLADAAAIISARGGKILKSTSDPPVLPSSAFDEILRSADQTYLYATPEPYLATRLHRVVIAINAANPVTTPDAVADLTRAMVRQSDAASAIGADREAEAIYAMARNISDLAVGLDPVSGVVRSAYELVTGQNMITGAQLTDAERAFAAVNLILLGDFGIASRGFKAIARIGQSLGGTRAAAIGKSVITIVQHWPVKTIERIMASWPGRSIVSATEHVALSASKALVPVGAVDGIYARAMSARYAEKLVTGGRLAADEIAFITEAKSIEGLGKWDDLRRKLSLMDKTNIGQYRAYADDVVVEFKFASNEPLAYLAKPFGEVGRFGPGFLPGGYTAGGVPEWVVDSLAADKGMIDLASIRIRPIAP